MPALVRTDRSSEPVALLRIDDPATNNRLSERLCAEIEEALADLAGNRAIRVLLLSGSPRVFCAGATIESLRRIAGGEFHVRDLATARRILEFPVPVVAAVEGHAVGGGLLLAACCDITVASESSRYGVNFTDLGFTPGMGATALLPSLLGPQFAAEMMFTAKFYKGRELKHRGLFTHVVPSAQVLPRARGIADRIAVKPRHVLEMLKETLALPRRMALQGAVARESLMHRICFALPGTAKLIEDAYNS
ncbi:MAG TPA: polyketide synthase [Candidatus Solibacter sp.]|nr:polyketide synthase [Candidatus Solibacter sp.]